MGRRAQPAPIPRLCTCPIPPLHMYPMATLWAGVLNLENDEVYVAALKQQVGRAEVASG